MSFLPPRHRSGDDERVAVLQRDLAVAPALDRLAVPLDERVTRGEAQAVEQRLDGLARGSLLGPTVDGDGDGFGAHERAARPPAGLEASAVSRSSINPA